MINEKRLKSFAKEFECNIKVEPRKEGLYLSIIGRYGQVFGLFRSGQELNKFVYTLRKRWKGEYYALGFEFSS